MLLPALRARDHRPGKRPAEAGLPDQLSLAEAGLQAELAVPSAPEANLPKIPLGPRRLPVGAPQADIPDRREASRKRRLGARGAGRARPGKGEHREPQQGAERAFEHRTDCRPNMVKEAFGRSLAAEQFLD